MISTRPSVTPRSGARRTTVADPSQERDRLVLELGSIQGREVRQCALRPDGRQLRLLFDGEQLLQISASIGEDGNAHLELDILHIPGLTGLGAVTRWPTR